MDRNKLLPLLFASITTAIILTATFKLDRMEREYLSQKNHADALNHLSLVRARIESALNSRLYLTRGLVAFVTNHPHLDEREFNEFAAALIRQQAGVHSIQLARDSIVSHIHPLKGNEPAMGLKLLEHGTSQEATRRAISLRKTVVNGPFKLVQGGTALVSRTPVFLPDDRYWGLASILIDQNALFAEAGLGRPHPSLEFAVRGKDNLGASGEIFWGDTRVFEPDSVRLDITLPDGSWQIAATHKEGWDTPGTMWLRYGGILLALLAGTLVWFLTRNPGRLHEEIEQATRELARSNRELNSEISERRRLEKEIIHVAEDEQKRIGQELHDGLGQHLTGIAFLGKALEQKLASHALPEKFDAAEIVQLVNIAIARTRALARGLFPVELEANGLMAALEHLAANTQTLYGIDCAFLCDEPVLVYDNVVAINLYRIAQEAVLNAVGHGRAKHILIELARADNNTLLKVSDNGIGYDPDTWEKSDGMGLHIMRYRTKMIGSSLNIEKSAGQGTVVSVSVNDSHAET